MNALILTLAPLGGLATALPAMSAAATRPRVRASTTARQRQPVEGARRTFDRREPGGPDMPIRERDGGYLLL